MKILRKTEKADIVCISIQFRLFCLSDCELFQRTSSPANFAISKMDCLDTFLPL